MTVGHWITLSAALFQRPVESLKVIGLSAVQAVDVPGAIELLDKPCVDKVLWIGIFRSGHPLGEIIENSFETFQRRIRLYLDKALAQLIGLLHFLLVANLHAFGEGALGKRMQI